jgi:hypothetical protein
LGLFAKLQWLAARVYAERGSINDKSCRAVPHQQLLDFHAEKYHA